MRADNGLDRHALCGDLPTPLPPPSDRVLLLDRPAARPDPVAEVLRVPLGPVPNPSKPPPEVFAQLVVAEGRSPRPEAGPTRPCSRTRSARWPPPSPRRLAPRHPCRRRAARPQRCRRRTLGRLRSKPEPPRQGPRRVFFTSTERSAQEGFPCNTPALTRAKATQQFSIVRAR